MCFLRITNDKSGGNGASYGREALVEIREKEEQKILVTQAKARVQCWQEQARRN
jgi:hypothetical protein